MVIAFGGDFTYLDSASKITNPQFTALFGINSVSDYEQEHLCEQRMEFDKHKNQVKEIVDCIGHAGLPDEEDHLEFYSRSRIMMQVCKYKSMKDQSGEVDHQKYYVLNEVMTSEKDPSILSIYRLTVNGRDLGKFRSSGIIISTGTGSTGWLYSAR